MACTALGQGDGCRALRALQNWCCSAGAAQTCSELKGESCRLVCSCAAGAWHQGRSNSSSVHRACLASSGPLSVLPVDMTDMKRLKMCVVSL